MDPASIIRVSVHYQGTYVVCELKNSNTTFVFWVHKRTTFFFISCNLQIFFECCEWKYFANLPISQFFKSLFQIYCDESLKPLMISMIALLYQDMPHLQQDMIVVVVTIAEIILVRNRATFIAIPLFLTHQYKGRNHII